jgi:hypothetical protein
MFGTLGNVSRDLARGVWWCCTVQPILSDVEDERCINKVTALSVAVYGS